MDRNQQQTKFHANNTRSSVSVHGNNARSGLSQQTIIQEVTEVTSVTDTTSIFSVIAALVAAPARTNVGGVSATAASRELETSDIKTSKFYRVLYH